MLRTRMIFTVITAFFLIFVGCGDVNTPQERDSCPNFYCPSISDNITWDKYGKLQIGNCGSDACARRLISKCGWHVYQMHNGGYGDTLEVTPTGEEVVLIWAWNDFSWMNIFQGWQGSTAEGVAIGSTLEEVQAAYPDLLYYYGNTYKLENASQKRKDVNVYFDFEDNKLVGITIF